MIKRYLIIFCLQLFALLMAAQKQTSMEKVEAWDNSRVAHRQFSQDTIAYYKNLPVYSYDRNPKKLTWLQRLLKWLMGSEQQTQSDPFTLQNWMYWLMIALAAVAVGYMILRLLGIPIAGFLSVNRKAEKRAFEFISDKEHIRQKPLELLLEDFIAQASFREAIRIHFLMVLRSLDAKEIIQWHRYKTDKEYYYEIKDAEISQSYLLLMRKYEYIWFGQFPVTKDEFEAIHQQFIDFKQVLTANTLKP